MRIYLDIAQIIINPPEEKKKKKSLSNKEINFLKCAQVTNKQ